MPGTLPEAEIHQFRLRELGLNTMPTSNRFRGRRRVGRPLAKPFSPQRWRSRSSERLVVGTKRSAPCPPHGGGGSLWFSAHQVAMRYPDQVRAAGHEGEDGQLGDALFRAMVENRDGVVFTKHEHSDSFNLLRTPDQKINVHIPELAAELASLADGPVQHTSEEFRSAAAGERRVSLRTRSSAPVVAEEGSRRRASAPRRRRRPRVSDGDRIRITTAAGAAVAVAEVNDTMQPGYVSLPNGMGLGHPPVGGRTDRCCAERADLDQGSDRRHAVAQARSGEPRSSARRRNDRR